MLRNSWSCYCLGLVGGSAIAILFLNYIQDNLNWALGFGIPCISMVIALLVFLMGSRTYRHTIKGHVKNPFFRIGKVFASAAWNWRVTDSVILSNIEAQETLRPESSQHHKSNAQPSAKRNPNRVRLTSLTLVCCCYWFVFMMYSFSFLGKFFLIVFGAVNSIF